MTDGDPHDDDFGQLWREQELSAPSISVDELRRKHRKFTRQIRLRNMREVAASVFVAFFFGWIAWREGNWLTRAGALEIVLASSCIVVVLLRRGRVDEPLDAGLDSQTYLAGYRHQLERQRRLLASAGLWYVAPLAVGLVAMLLGSVLYEGLPWTMFWSMLGGSLLLSLGVIALNHWAARDLQRKIDRLSSKN